MTQENLTQPARTCPHGQTVVGFEDADPFGFFAALQEMGSPVWDPTAKAWLIHDYDQCLASERDESRFANAYVFADPIVTEIKGGGANITLSRDAEHMKLRRFHFKLLSAAMVETYRQPHVTSVIDAVLDRLAGRDTADLAADYAAQIPPRVICSLLGMPIDDDAMVEEILARNVDIVNFIASGYRDEKLRDIALQASHRLNEMLLPWIVERKNNPADDFISRVWKEAPAFDIDLDEAGALGLCRELFFAGSDTTVHGIANALYLILKDPDLLRAAREDESGEIIERIVEEALRLYAVVQFRHRICLADTEVGDTLVRKGDVIILLHAAANRSPDKYACPGAADMHRDNPSEHLTFAKGTRSCVGAQLARVEMREAVCRLIDRFPNVCMDATGEAPYFRGLYMRSMGPLHVRMTP